MDKYMDMKNKFKEEDRKKLVAYMNSVHTHCKFNDMSQQQIIEHFKLLAYIQQEVIPKIEANILEIVALHEDNKDI